jgi:hypothetical protein
MVCIQNANTKSLINNADKFEFFNFDKYESNPKIEQVKSNSNPKFKQRPRLRKYLFK